MYFYVFQFINYKLIAKTFYSIVNSYVFNHSTKIQNR
jgi:hypothetical protein